MILWIVSESEFTAIYFGNRVNVQKRSVKLQAMHIQILSSSMWRGTVGDSLQALTVASHIMCVVGINSLIWLAAEKCERVWCRLATSWVPFLAIIPLFVHPLRLVIETFVIKKFHYPRLTQLFFDDVTPLRFQANERQRMMGQSNWRTDQFDETMVPSFFTLTSHP